jgi:hypothetical protein
LPLLPPFLFDHVPHFFVPIMSYKGILPLYIVRVSVKVSRLIYGEISFLRFSICFLPALPTALHCTVCIYHTIPYTPRYNFIYTHILFFLVEDNDIHTIHIHYTDTLYRYPNLPTKPQKCSPTSPSSSSPPARQWPRTCTTTTAPSPPAQCPTTHHLSLSAPPAPAALLPLL